MKSTLLAAILVLSTNYAQAEVVEKIVAIVNTEVILSSDLKKLTQRIQKSNFTDDLLLMTGSVEDLRKSNEAQLKYLINERLIESEIKKLNLNVTMDRVEQEIKNIARMNNMKKENLFEALSAQGISISDYQDLIKTRIERQSLIESEITSKINVSDEDVLAQYLSKNPNTDGVSSEYKLAHILFLPQKGGAEAALERAKTTLAKIKSGQVFEKVAEQNSEDPNFTAGGYLGTFKSGEFGKELEAAVSKLKPNEISEVVQTRMGFHILKLNNKKIINDPEYDKQKEAIRANLKEAAFRKHFVVWLDNKKESAFIRINQ